MSSPFASDGCGWALRGTLGTKSRIGTSEMGPEAAAIAAACASAAACACSGRAVIIEKGTQERGEKHQSVVLVIPLWGLFESGSASAAATRP
jgi:hypothetical protein